MRSSVAKFRSSASAILGRRFSGALVVLATVCIGVWLGRIWLLRSAADLWIVSDPVQKADAVAVLGGGVQDRPFAAARYYREGLVKTVVISNDDEGPAEQLGAVVPDAVANRDVLLRLGVPADAIQSFGERLKNTQEEAVALHDWADRAGVHSIVVPTEIFAARRVRWTLRHFFGNKYVILVDAIEPPRYNRFNWWHSHEGLLDFQNEIIKYLYYRFEY